MFWISKGIHQIGRTRRRLLLLLAVVGPGIITMVADNDAGGIQTYAVTGSRYGFNLLWVFFILIPMAYYVQEMTVRLGAVTKRGHAEAIFDAFGSFWGWFSIFDLAVVNWLTLVTEYIGMVEAGRMFHIPGIVTYFVVTIILMLVVMSGKYWTFEKLTLFFCIFNLVYIPAAFWAMHTQTAPAWSEVARGFYHPVFPNGLDYTLIFFLMANIGTTITPWQIFFQQSSVVDKGMDVRDINMGKIDTFLGSLFTGLVAIFIIITTGAALYYHHPQIIVNEVPETANALRPLLPGGRGEWARILFGIGLFDAGFLGALCISLSTSWAVGEVFGWAHSLNRSVRDAPWFYVVYLGTLGSAGLIPLLVSPNVLVIITMFVQVVAVTLLPAALFFLILLLNDRNVMGDYVNTRWQNIVNWGIAIFTVVISAIFAVITLFKKA